MQYNLRLENQGKMVTFQATIGTSITDVTLTARLSVTVKNWRVSTNPSFSDHNEFELTIEQEDGIQHKKWVKMYWLEFRRSLTIENIRIVDSMTTNCLEECLHQLYSQIKKHD